MKGNRFFDRGTVFDTYQKKRQKRDNANDTLEKPIVMELMGDVKGLEVLDLGCGDARYGKELIHLGARRYTGVESSSKMVKAALENLQGTQGKVIQSDIEEWSYPMSSFDQVVSRLVLHYVENLVELLKRVYQTLKPGGRVLFSVEHPVITSSYGCWPEDQHREDWIVVRYFNRGFRTQFWMGEEVEKYHRTVEDYFLSLQQAGFVVECLRESCPDQRYFVDEETYKRRTRIPLFLFLPGNKPSLEERNNM